MQLALQILAFLSLAHPDRSLRKGIRHQGVQTLVFQTVDTKNSSYYGSTVQLPFHIHSRDAGTTGEMATLSLSHTTRPCPCRNGGPLVPDKTTRCWTSTTSITSTSNCWSELQRSELLRRLIQSNSLLSCIILSIKGHTANSSCAAAFEFAMLHLLEQDTISGFSSKISDSNPTSSYMPFVERIHRLL